MSKDQKKSSEFSTETPTKNELSITELSKELANLKDKCLEERFLWFCAVVLLLDGYIFPKFHWTTALGVLFFELIIITILGRRWGYEEITLHTNKIYNLIEQWINKLKISA